MKILKDILEGSLLQLTKKVAMFVLAALLFSHVVGYGWNVIGFGGIKNTTHFWRYR